MKDFIEKVIKWYEVLGIYFGVDEKWDLYFEWLRKW